MLNFIGFALIVQLALAIALAIVREFSSEHRREVGRVLRLPSFSKLLLRTVVAKLLHWFTIDYRRRARAPAAERLQPIGAANPDRPSHLAVFVRGTFGAEGYDSRWEKVVAALRPVHPRTAFFCFFWPGRNGEGSRRAEGAVLAEALSALHARHPDLPIFAIGHSHGGTVIEHASRGMSGNVPLVPILLAALVLQYDEKLADRSHAHLTALLYASAVFIPALLLHVAGWTMALLGYPWLQAWNLAWFAPVAFLVVLGVFALRPAARHAREVLGATPPAPRHVMRHIWCRGDEVFDTFAHTDAIRIASDTLREAWHERLEALRNEPWLRMILIELVTCALCWGLMATGVRELARADPAMLHPLVREPGVAHEAAVMLAAMLLKLLVYGRPRLYRALASITSLVLFAMRAGIAQVCRATLAGLSFTEGILVETLTRQPVHDGVTQVEVASSVKPTLKMDVHRATLAEDEALRVMARMAAAVPPG